ncbi:MAG: hypothetical protein VXY07_16085 [Planctomycetota bacterium]|jgi:hypothetical protein|nr:hypothetical protein [Pirellulaceae bacterium]MEC7110480.1 hypothetical protein [Planctomycetota bacterium]MDP7376525.1 hypothetical protein [Pirellulaceae bacterium]MEC7355680.1 hypothetical protein [Planctomycetota bacterium]MEC7429684.1 hypothetical protein [Planctomycetota bacterium]
MNWIDISLLSVGIYLSVILLVRMMRQRQNQGLAELRERWRAERDRQRNQPT